MRGLRIVVDQLLLSDGPRRSTWALNLEQAVGSWLLELDAPEMRALVADELAGARVANAEPALRDLTATVIAAGLDRGGDRDGARSLLRDVLARDRSADAWMLAGRLALRDGRARDAVAAFVRAAALDPSRADAPYYASRLAARP